MSALYFLPLIGLALGLSACVGACVGVFIRFGMGKCGHGGAYDPQDQRGVGA